MTNETKESKNKIHGKFFVELRQKSYSRNIIENYAKLTNKRICRRRAKSNYFTLKIHSKGHKVLYLVFANNSNCTSVYPNDGTKSKRRQKRSEKNKRKILSTRKCRCRTETENAENSLEQQPNNDNNFTHIIASDAIKTRDKKSHRKSRRNDKQKENCLLCLFVRLKMSKI